MERFFNIAGPCVAAKHYTQPVTAADMAEAKERIIREQVAVLNSIRKRLDDNWMKKALGLIGRPTSDVDADVGGEDLDRGHSAGRQDDSRRPLLSGRALFF